MNTISRRLFVMIVLLLTVMSGGAGILYAYGARALYISEQKKTLEEVYGLLLQENIPELCERENRLKNEAAEDEWEELSGGLLEEYENKNLRFRIRDENYELLYATNKTAQVRSKENDTAQNSHLMKLYSEKPKAEYDENVTGGRVVLRGKHVWNGATYYILITESATQINRSTEYAQQVLLLVLLAFLVLGAFLVRIISRGIGLPVEQAARAARQIASKDFSERVEKTTKYRELNELSDSINLMSQQIQNYIRDLETFNQLLQQENLRRVELEQHRKRFVNNVSHELKTPLAIISGQVEMLPMIHDSGKREDYCNSVMEEIGRMNDMIQSMLQIFSVEQGFEDISMEQLDLGRLAKEAFADFMPLFVRQELRAKFEADKESGAEGQNEQSIEAKNGCGESGDFAGAGSGKACMIQGNQENLRRAMNNFLMNAYRYAPKGSHVKVMVAESGNYIIFSVYNEGSQISEKDMERLWDSFYQGRESSGQGPGLGLYIVKSIVAQHGGVCGAENQGNGVEFWFGIPKAGDTK